MHSSSSTVLTSLTVAVTSRLRSERCFISAVSTARCCVAAGECARILLSNQPKSSTETFRAVIQRSTGRMDRRDRLALFCGDPALNMLLEGGDDGRLTYGGLRGRIIFRRTVDET